MLNIDYFAYSNRLVSAHPAEKAAFALITMFICLASTSLAVYAVITVLMAGAVVVRAGIPLAVYMKLMAVPTAFLLVSVAVVALSVSEQTGGYLAGFGLGSYYIGIHPEDFATALRLLFRSLGAVSCLYFLTMTTPLVEVINMLRRLKLPLVIIDIMVLTYRFIFVLMETAESIYISQSSRLGYRNLKTSHRSLGSLAANLLSRAYHRSEALFTAMASRGYTGEIKVLQPHYILSGKNVAIIIAIDSLLALLSLADWSGGGLFGRIYF